MIGSYWLGVIAAVSAGVAFNIAVLMQKLAIMRTDGGAGLIRRLIRSPLWLAGFALQFLVGMPLNVLAQAMIGPAILPGLMATGLIALAIGASKLAGERLKPGELVGIALVMASAALFGLSRMSVDLSEIDLFDPAFVLRLGEFTASVAALSFACNALQKAKGHLRGMLRILNSGLLLSQSNLWLGVLMALLPRLSSGKLSIAGLLYTALASTIVFAGSMLGISETQHALSCGDVSKLMPIQYLPSQVLPIAVYFVVFSLHPKSISQLLLALAGIVCVITGAALLAKRQDIKREVLTNEG